MLYSIGRTKVIQIQPTTFGEWACARNLNPVPRFAVRCAGREVVGISASIPFRQLQAISLQSAYRRSPNAQSL